jgi:hypothetical protein
MSEGWRDQFENSEDVACVIDRNTIIVYCNPRWDSFALRNGGPRAAGGHVKGRSLFSYIPSVLEPYYRKIIGTAISERKVGESDYECHSADKFCVYRLRLLPIAGTKLLAMVHSLRTEGDITLETRDRSADERSPGEAVSMCAHCRRTWNRKLLQWDWVPDFVRTPPPVVTHGLCPRCAKRLYA